MSSKRLSGSNPSRRTILKGAATAALAVSMGPLLLGTKSARAQAKLKKMSIFIGTTPHFGNIIVGDAKGLFEKEGLPVEVTNFASGSVAADAFRAGRGNVVVTGDLPAIRLWSQGNIGFCPQANYSELSIIVGQKAIKSAKDLKGKTIGVLMGSTSEFFAKLYLEKGGVKWNEVEVANLRPAEMVTGLVRGDIHAFVIWQPFGWRAMAADPDAHIITTAGGYFHEWEACTTTKEYAKDHAAELVAFCKGLDAAGNWIKANPEEAAKVVAAGIRLDDPKLAADMLAKIDWNIAYTPKFRKDIDVVSTFLNIKVDWNTMFDPQFLKKANPKWVE